MPRFYSDRFPPGFFDLPAGAGETLPLDVIGAWTSSEQTPEVARATLAPFLRRGVVVASDSSGLTRLSQVRPLIEILALVSHPKELIHGCGTAIGGRAVGVWAADNTLMFYGDDIAADTIVSMLLTVRERLARECELGVGIGAHIGEFFELGGGIHGHDADRVELLAETYTDPGDLLITDTLADKLPGGHGCTLALRDGLPGELGTVYQVDGGPALSGLDASNVAYPAPYSSDFNDGIGNYLRTRRDSQMPRKPYEECAVVCVVREAEDPDIPEIAVLNDLALAAAMARISAELLTDGKGEIVKVAGRLGFYTFSDCARALVFSRAVRDALAEQNIRCRIGIDYGLVLVFDLGDGARDLAGLPVNVASKLSEDTGEYGMIQMSEVAAREAGAPRARPTREISISGVELRAYDV